MQEQQPSLTGSALYMHMNTYAAPVRMVRCIVRGVLRKEVTSTPVVCGRNNACLLTCNSYNGCIHASIGCRVSPMSRITPKQVGRSQTGYTQSNKEKMVQRECWCCYYLEATSPWQWHGMHWYNHPLTLSSPSGGGACPADLCYGTQLL
jgi:hypothetical protein